MRAVVMHETGDPGVLRLEQVKRPEPGDGEVLIKVAAAAVNPIDWKFRRGLIPKQLPAVLGSDVSGTVELSRADGLAAGDEVFGMASGAYAEYALARGAAIAKLPRGVTHEQAAAIPVAGLTAWQALFDQGGLKAGQTVLIAGAAGGVGHFAVQLARHAGARTIGIGSEPNREFVLSLGADEYVDYRTQNVAEAVHDGDLAFDTVGAASASALLGGLREGATMVTIAGGPPESDAQQRGVQVVPHVTSPNATQLAEIAALVAGGEVRVQIAQALPLAEAPRAHELSEAGHTRGKLVLAIAG